VQWNMFDPRLIRWRLSAVTRRTTVLVLGDAQQRQRSEPRRFRRDRPQGARDDLADTGAAVLLVPRQLHLPAYAEFCDRVRVVRDLNGLERAAHELRASN
jgi:uncharacterized protein